jgi:hypothetical protein
MIGPVEPSLRVCEPGEALAITKSRLHGRMTHPNLFLVSQDDIHAAFAKRLCRHLGRMFPVAAFEQVLPQPGGGSDGTRYLFIVIDSSRPEEVRDAIRERLWPTGREVGAAGSLADVLQGRHEKTSLEFRLDEYGIFVPCRMRTVADVRVHSFAHPLAFYRYRVALARTARLHELAADYLLSLFTDCPNHLFNETVCRASRLSRSGLRVEVPLQRLKRHPVISLAGESCGFSEVSSRHENLQKFFLEHDPDTVACEAPVWMEAWELADYSRLVGSRQPLTGHIDVLRCEGDGLLGVWDYKPRAAAERSAHVQVFLYALMLAMRTGVPLCRLLCGYFDENDAYTFQPCQVELAWETGSACRARRRR